MPGRDKHVDTVDVAAYLGVAGPCRRQRRGRDHYNRNHKGVTVEDAAPMELVEEAVEEPVEAAPSDDEVAAAMAPKTPKTRALRWRAPSSSR
ncbi:hypothetical protein JL721_12304 [Aureococcus anophagefferens]|nr:hypothetical protein JL721_12304 [Aureococcus anophagefferens]